MADDFTNNKILRYFYPILFLIPLNFFIISSGIGSGIQWFFFKYQTTVIGDSLIPTAAGLQYILSGTITGKSVFFEVSPLVSLAVFFIAFMYILSNQTKMAGILTILSGIISLSTAVIQYGVTLHGAAGVYIPFGSAILLAYGVMLSLSVPDPTGENLLVKYDYLILLFGVFLVYVNWANPLFMNDTIGTQALPYSILENHTVYLDETYQTCMNAPKTASLRRNFAYRFVSVEGDHYASIFPIVTPVLITPLYAIPYFFNIPRSSILDLVMSHLASALISAFSVVFIYLACRYVSSRKVAVLSALVFAFATNTWSFSSQQLYAHGMSELLLAAMIFLVIRNEYRNSTENIVFLGICSGLFIFNRPSDSILVLPVVGYVLWYHREKIGQYLFSGFLSGLPFLFYNVLLFHNLFGGYSKIASRLSFDMTILSNYLGLLISPNRGLFVFSPILILAVFGFWIMKDNNKPVYRFLEGTVIAMAITIMVYASFDDWQGGDTYGPRYLTCILPYLVIGLCIFFDDIVKKPRKTFVVAVIVMLVAISVFIQFIGFFYFRPTQNPAQYWPDQFCPYDAWDYTDLVIINSLFHKDAKLIMRNDNGEWLKKIIEEGG